MRNFFLVYLCFDGYKKLPSTTTMPNYKNSFEALKNGSKKANRDQISLSDKMRWRVRWSGIRKWENYFFNAHCMLLIVIEAICEEIAIQEDEKGWNIARR